MDGPDLVLLADKQKHLAGQLTSPCTVTSATGAHDWAMHELLHYISEQQVTKPIYGIIILFVF